jgi:hypothetical protein
MPGLRRAAAGASERHERVSTMLRARRVAFVAVLALVGGLALTGCRSQPGMAVYVGSAKYTQKDVDKLADQLANVPGYPKSAARGQVVQWLVVRDLDKRLIAGGHWSAPPVDLAGATSQFEQALQVPDAAAAKKVVADSRPLITLFAEVNAYGAVVRQHASAARPSDADYQDLYDHAKAAGLVQGGQDEAAYRQSLGPQNEQVFAQTIGLKNLYKGALGKANVSVNPKYGPADLVLLPDSSNHTLVELPLTANGRQSAVVPAPAPLDAGTAQVPADNG